MSEQRGWVAAEDEAARAGQVVAAYTAQYGRAPMGVARAPGRVNLIGEHTDYNGGFVLPLAIDRSLLVAYGAATLDSLPIRAYSLDFDQRDSVSPYRLAPEARHAPVQWYEYVRGVVWALRTAEIANTDLTGGVNLAIGGNVPLGAGLSSSAALEVATAFALNALVGRAETTPAWRTRAALECQRAENQYVGANVGIMDQFISALGATDSALFIDCRSLAFRTIPLGLDARDVAVVAVNSAVPHSHATGQYNIRRAQCDEAVAIMAEKLGKAAPGVQLRDFSLADLDTCRADLSDLLYRRARHVISENARTQRAAELLEQGDLDAIGDLLYASHTSMRDDYQITVPEIDMLVDAAQQTPGVIGSRMTGGGFGGCTVSLVHRASLDAFATQVVAAYRARTGLPAEMYVCRAVAGGSIL